MQAAVSAGQGQAVAHQRRPGWVSWMFLSPMLLWMAVFVIIPTSILLVYSFCERGQGTPVAYTFTWENYARVFRGTQIWPLVRSALQAAGLALAAVGIKEWLYRSATWRERVQSLRTTGLPVFIVALLWIVWNSLEEVFTGTYVRIFARSIYYAGGTTLLCVIIGFPVAYFIGRANPSRRNQLLTLVMIPFWTSFLIRTYAWITILSESGLLNSSLQSARLIQEPFEMLYTPGAVVLGLVYTYLPFMILPIYGSVEKLDNSLVEAAFDLGAGPIRAFQKVIIPLTQPGIIAGVLLVFIPAIGMFAITDLMGGKTVPMIGNVIQNQFTGQARDWPFGAALGMTLLIMFGIAFWITSRKRSGGDVMG
jgi:spermidine/putrescine transport system permease protein